MKPNEPVIRRYFSEDVFPAIREDVKFLVDKINSGFDYDFQIRPDNSFNIYCRGNSIGEIKYTRNEKYSVVVHKKFITDEIENEFKGIKDKNGYLRFSLTRKQIHPFYKSKNLTSMYNLVKKNNYGEELAFEHMLIVDNVRRNDFIIIDRQIRDASDRVRVDMLALTKKQNSDYQFCVIEVKLGNNKELEREVGDQLDKYIARVGKYFDDYKKCYQINFRQKQELGFFAEDLEINIVRGILSLVVVGGYSRQAEQKIDMLKKLHPEIKVLPFKNEINLAKSF